MATRNKQQKPKPKAAVSTAQLVKTEVQNPQGPFGDIAGHFLPGMAPLDQRATPLEQRVSKITRQQTQTFNGPIPHPEIFRKYGEVIHDAPERILRVFEEDSKHVRDIQMGALNAQKSDNRRVHWMAWSLIAGGYAMSALFAWMNKDVLAGMILTTTIVGTVTGFLQSQKKSTSSEDKDE